MCGEVDPPSLLVEAVLDLGDAPHDALTQEGLAPDSAEANRDAARGRRVRLVPDGRLEGRRTRPEEAGWIRGAKEAPSEHHQDRHEPRAAPHRLLTGAAPSPCGPPRSTLGSRSRDSASARTDSSASRSATRLVSTSSRASFTPAAACPTA